MRRCGAACAFPHLDRPTSTSPDAIRAAPRFIDRFSTPAMLALASTVLIGPAAMAEPHGERCVRVGAACYPTVQAAVDAAQDGDTVQIPAGRFAVGWWSRRASRSPVPALRPRTWSAGSTSSPSVPGWPLATKCHIRGVTLRGGRAHSSPESIDFTGKPGVFAGGEAGDPRRRARQGHGGGQCDHREQRQPDRLDPAHARTGALLAALPRRVLHRGRRPRGRHRELGRSHPRPFEGHPQLLRRQPRSGRRRWRYPELGQPHRAVVTDLRQPGEGRCSARTLRGGRWNLDGSTRPHSRCSTARSATTLPA